MDPAGGGHGAVSITRSSLGHTNHQIASALFVSARTAQDHVQHILTKLGAHNPTQIATWFNARRDAQQTR
ncbi:MAG: LuxR C-terminal-related transcriptional regulator [Acidimicrobiales bacterium]